MTALRALERFARPIRTADHQACEICQSNIGDHHPHVVDLQQRSLCCACQACSLLFEKPGAANGRFRTVPSRVRIDPSFVLSEEQWTALDVPVRLAFFLFNSTQQGWSCFYPSPAGATESQISLAAWEALAAQSSLAKSVQPDVEAFLAYAARGERQFESFLVPIDVCYELVARVRKSWTGLGGGDATREIDAFFRQLRGRAKPLEKAARGGES